MGALPHCTPIFPSLSCWPPTLQSRSHNTSASELAKADSALYPENPQFNSQSIPRTHGTARHGTAAGAPLRRCLSPCISAPTAKRASHPSDRRRAEESQLHPAGTQFSAPGLAPLARPAHPARGALSRDSRALPFRGCLRDHRPGPASSPQRRGCRRALPAAPLLPRARSCPTCRDPQSGWRAQCSSREGQQ